jgi:hypothetical protein
MWSTALRQRGETNSDSISCPSKADSCRHSDNDGKAKLAWTAQTVRARRISCEHGVATDRRTNPNRETGPDSTSGRADSCGRRCQQMEKLASAP